MAWEKVAEEFNARNSIGTRVIPALKNSFTIYEKKAHKARCDSNQAKFIIGSLASQGHGDKEKQKLFEMQMKILELEVEVLQKQVQI
ncbi:hypothetical protein HHI36_017115 [Cryptolaemus montrouzieri]|uniref:Regulatory protein zeste n=1 Tax=Cryptolaemus montrouzieri TaxID=559131 RepID=A0ABD2NLV2_9CUCU